MLSQKSGLGRLRFDVDERVGGTQNRADSVETGFGGLGEKRGPDVLERIVEVA